MEIRCSGGGGSLLQGAGERFSNGAGEKMRGKLVQFYKLW